MGDSVLQDKLELSVGAKSLGLDLSSPDAFTNQLIKQSLSSDEKAIMPKQAIATTSFISDILKGNTTPDEALGEIGQMKADLRARLGTGESLTRPQAVSLAFISLLPALIGAAIKGKKGLGKGAEAGQLGGLFALQEFKGQNKKQDTIISEAIKNLEEQEKDIYKLGFERIKASEEYIRDLGKIAFKGKVDPSGANINVNTGNLVGKTLPASLATEILKTGGTGTLGLEIAKELEALPSDSTLDTVKFQLSKGLSSTKVGQLNSKLTLFQRMVQAAIEGKRGSDQDNIIFQKIVSGNFDASPQVTANLVRQAASAMARINLATIEGFQQLQNEEGVEAFKGNLQSTIGEAEKFKTTIPPDIQSLINKTKPLSGGQ